MKYLLLLTLLSGCSLIKIQEAPEPEKIRQVLILTEYLCSDGSELCEQNDTLHISKDKIEFYSDALDKNNCCNLKLLGVQTIHKLKMSCSELDEMLNR